MLLFQPGYTEREVIKAAQGSRELGISWTCRATSAAGADEVPVGSVEFCESIWRQQTGTEPPKPDFWPEWLEHMMHRQIVAYPSWTKPTFCKSGSGYKVAQAEILKPRCEDNNPVLPAEPIFCEVVEFVQEWRYYVAGGKVMATGWYDGHNEDEPAPELSVKWPADWCGAADFGRLSTGEIALVECQHPYACGWYGDDHQAFVRWLIDGWNWMKKSVIDVLRPGQP